MKKIMLLVFASAVILTACSAANPKENTSSKTQTSIKTKEVYKETKGHHVTYYTMNPDPVFGSTATLIAKDGKGLLVDTQFSKDDTDKIIRVAKDKKIEIETIYISYGDPDYYFGAEQVKTAFPKAKVLATKNTIERIQKSYKKKLNVWANKLKDKAPKKIIIPAPVQSSIQLNGETFTVFGKDAKKQTLYNKKDQLLLGGILVSTGHHLFIADTKTVESQKQWIKDLNELSALKAKVVIPGHFGKGDNFSAENIAWTKAYLEKFIEVEKTSKNSAEIIKKMQKAYPHLAKGSLEMSAKVVSGEQPWE
ncbi:MBL fold hydrolase [Listeria sp. PSOL-1]|uniref:MBL fold hydrolase n=1 Tax=Listeria sp. PSOL-1 TaxID=1844999 RepID=UPI001E552185|nr:MBL fold hydrolase [Listeria sp. PSOL-1]